MKPKNWDKLAPEDKIDLGGRLRHSNRGRYILSQALVVAIEALNKEPANRKEVSNIQDMEILAETEFSVFSAVIKLERDMIRAGLIRPVQKEKK